MAWVLLLVAEFGVLFLISYFLGKRKKRQSQLYSIIVAEDSEVVPIQTIMSALQLDFRTVSRDIGTMSSTDAMSYPLLKNSHIDISRQVLVLSKERLEKQRKKTAKLTKKQYAKPATDQTGIECKCCGAINKNPSASECEYCGSPLK